MVSASIPKACLLALCSHKFLKCLIAVLAWVSIQVFHGMDKTKVAMPPDIEDVLITASNSLIELMVATERAYLRIEKWQPPRFESGKVFITGLAVNTGKTPAWNVKSRSVISLHYPNDELTLGDARKVWPEPPSGGALAAGGSTYIEASREVSEENVKEVEDGRVAIYVDGICSYFDSLGGRQFYVYGFTLMLKPYRTWPRYERHHRTKAN